MKISFHSYANKTNFHVRSFALNLAFMARFTATWKWPIEVTLQVFIGQFYTVSLFNILLSRYLFCDENYSLVLQNNCNKLFVHLILTCPKFTAL